MQWEVVGVIVTLVGLAAAVGGPVLKLNGSITRLTTLLQAIEHRLDTLEQGAKEQRTHAAESHRRIWNHNDEQDARLEDHEKRITLLEQQRTK
mgnify:FL=1